MELFEVQKDEAGFRIDQWLADKFKPQFSRTYFVELIDEGLVLINGESVKKREKVAPGDTVEVCFAERPGINLAPEPIPLDIVYEDKDLLVVNKPAGLVVHPAPGNESGTFVNALLYHCQGRVEDKSLRPGIVHRLDKDTTGLLVAAKNLEAQKRLIHSFSNRNVKKEYLAITVGRPREGRLETKIGRDPKNRKKMAVLEKTSEQGKTAITEIQVLKTKKELSWVRLILETGRTHQIRVHLQHLNTPILGDPLYGSRTANLRYKADNIYLHAWRLSFPHPTTGQILAFEVTPTRLSSFFELGSV